MNYDYKLLQTTVPVTEACLKNWTADCRASINYTSHIQPLWEKDSRDSSGKSCVSCHDGDGGVRLDLKSIAGDFELRVYNELFKVHANYVYILDNFEQVSARKCKNIAQSPYPPMPDNNCDICFVYQLMSKDGAFESATFFDLFDHDDNDDAWYFMPYKTTTVDHDGMLSPSELKLIVEWLDRGAPLD